MRRFLGVVIVVSALLVFVNACDAESDASDAFRSGEYVESQLDMALQQRHDAELENLSLEGGSLVVALAGIAVLLFKR